MFRVNTASAVAWAANAAGNRMAKQKSLKYYVYACAFNVNLVALLWACIRNVSAYIAPARMPSYVYHHKVSRDWPFRAH